ncbi:MAG: ATP-binding protein [Bacteroidales bacterium]|nr:ATP-binding protein [Bacteroidales bacterium]MDD4234691.1 ATP-binding protein [Bacteroidales bacterium]
MKIAIASGKGGTGKTLVSVNLAYLWSEIYNTKTVLVDLDVEEPNDHVFFQEKISSSTEVFRPVPNFIKERCIFCSKCHDVCRFNAITMFPDTVIVSPELCHSCYACAELCPSNALIMTHKKNGVIRNYGKDNVLLYDGLLDVGEASAVPLITELKSQVLSKHNNSVDYFFDSPPGTSCPMIESIRDVDFVILVAEPTPFGIHDMDLAIQTVQLSDTPLGVVINKDNENSQKIYEKCKEYNVPILAAIPHKREIASFLANGGLATRKFDEIKISLTQLVEELKIRINNN